MNPDYGGPYFQQTHSMLVQLDVRDVNNALIPVWDFYKALRPGTLVLANCSLHCFLLKDSNPPRKVLSPSSFQYNIN